MWLSSFQVEDMRVIIHNLGKFLSNRDVKVCFLVAIFSLLLKTIYVARKQSPINDLHEQELVQSALLESNTGRDDKILYEKLVKISDL